MPCNQWFMNDNLVIFLNDYHFGKESEIEIKKSQTDTVRTTDWQMIPSCVSCKKFILMT